LKKDFDDRKDKDIDNDGDVDSSDKYLAKRRKAVSKAISKEEVDLDEVAGTFTIVANGISDLKKADEKYLEDTEFNIASSLVEDGVELDEEGVSYKGNSIMIPSDNEDMRMVQSWAKNQTKLAANTVKMIKPNMDYNDLYEERADHLYVAALLTKTAKPNRAPKYSVKFMKEEVDLDVVEDTMAKVREFKIQDMKAALAQVWGMEEGKNPFKKEEEEKPVITKGGKTLTGKKPAEIDVKPKINKEA
jgi:hypothetical protein